MCSGFYYKQIILKFPKNHRNERAYHTAWTPSSFPDLIVLMGGQDEVTRNGAEIVHNVTRDGVEILQGEPWIVKNYPEEL